MTTTDEALEILNEVLREKEIGLFLDSVHPDGTLLTYCNKMRMLFTFDVSPRFVIDRHRTMIYIPDVIKDVTDSLGRPKKTKNGEDVYELINDINDDYAYGSAFISPEGNIAYRLTIPQDFITYDTLKWSIEMAFSMCETIYEAYENYGNPNIF